MRGPTIIALFCSAHNEHKLIQLKAGCDNVLLIECNMIIPQSGKDLPYYKFLV
jgi:hypothetical protein